eukprot:TRINITY_DN11021_c0_g2_i1.p2 TRINITY_DN11021_c0_g2~~TRINITY_DN11021_c0_g2_i1.p2  ORF type:complete len:133 (-),score=22.51 TRINITY_DN11021_c0_g2_i1:204-602(-)
MEDVTWVYKRAEGDLYVHTDSTNKRKLLFSRKREKKWEGNEIRGNKCFCFDIQGSRDHGGKGVDGGGREGSCGGGNEERGIVTVKRIVPFVLICLDLGVRELRYVHYSSIVIPPSFSSSLDLVLTIFCPVLL